MRTANTMTGNENAAVTEVLGDTHTKNNIDLNPNTPSMTMEKRIGSTVYEIGVYFDQTGKETMEDKLLRLIMSGAVELDEEGMSGDEDNNTGGDHEDNQKDLTLSSQQANMKQPQTSRPSERSAA